MYTNCMLLVVNGDANEPIVYSSNTTADTITEVEKACVNVGIDPDEDETLDIANALDDGEVYWYNEQWCFQIIPIR